MNPKTYTFPHCIFCFLSIISGLTAWSFTARKEDSNTVQIHNNPNLTNNFYASHPHLVGYLDTFYTLLTIHFYYFLTFKTSTHENFATH